MSNKPPTRPAPRGRGATYNPANRYHSTETVAEDDGWGSLDAETETLATTLEVDSSRSVITYNSSPDIPFDRSINPYRGCEHGCIYCYARPSHAWLGLSPGLDFESRLFYKADAANLLRKELAHKNYRPAQIALGANTDAYQPVERRLGITRKILGVLADCRHPVAIVTKSTLVERDIDLLTGMAQDGLSAVHISITTLDARLARSLEPRAAAPQRRLKIIERLAEAGIPVGVMVAPVIPGLGDAELETILSRAGDCGATFANYSLLRLPGEVAPLFRQWLDQHYPDHARRVLAILRDTRKGADNDARFGSRMSGEGPFASLIAQRFSLAKRRCGYNEPPALETDRFLPPAADQAQLSLF